MNISERHIWLVPFHYELKQAVKLKLLDEKEAQFHIDIQDDLYRSWKAVGHSQYRKDTSLLFDLGIILEKDQNPRILERLNCPIDLYVDVNNTDKSGKSDPIAEGKHPDSSKFLSNDAVTYSGKAVTASEKARSLKTPPVGSKSATLVKQKESHKNPENVTPRRHSLQFGHTVRRLFFPSSKKLDPTSQSQQPLHSHNNTFTQGTLDTQIVNNDENSADETEDERNSSQESDIDSDHSRDSVTEHETYDVSHNSHSVQGSLKVSDGVLTSKTGTNQNKSESVVATATSSGVITFPKVARKVSTIERRRRRDHIRARSLSPQIGISSQPDTLYEKVHTYSKVTPIAYRLLPGNVSAPLGTYEQKSKAKTPKDQESSVSDTQETGYTSVSKDWLSSLSKADKVSKRFSASTRGLDPQLHLSSSSSEESSEAEAEVESAQELTDQTKSASGANSPKKMAGLFDRRAPLKATDLLPPPFDGRGLLSAKDFWVKFTDYLAIQGLKNDLPAAITCLGWSLSGDARRWLDESSFKTLKEVEESFLRTFDPLRSRPAILRALSQKKYEPGDSLVSYLGEIRSLVHRLGLTEESVKDYFLAGLPDRVREALVLCQEQSLQKLYEKAQDLLENTDSWKLKTMSQDIGHFHAVINSTMQDIKTNLDDIKGFKNTMSKIQACQSDLTKEIASLKNERIRDSTPGEDTQKSGEKSESPVKRGEYSSRGRGRTGRRGNYGRGGPRNLNNVQCYSCGVYGHIQVNCPYNVQQFPTPGNIRRGTRRPQQMGYGQYRGVPPAYRGYGQSGQYSEAQQYPTNDWYYGSYDNSYTIYPTQDPSLEWHGGQVSQGPSVGASIPTTRSN